MKYLYRKPLDPDPVVDACFSMSSDGRSQGVEHLIIPDGTPGLMVVQAGRFCRIKGAEKTTLSAGRYYLFGQKTDSVEYRFEQGDIKAFGAKLRPAALFGLFGIPADELVDQVIEVSELNGTKTWPNGNSNQLIPQNENQLAASLRKQFLYAQNGFSLLVEQLLQDIHQPDNMPSIRALSEKYNLGYKRLERLFKKHVGLTPKRYMRIIRFNACVKYALKAIPCSLTDIAYQNGFFDQMHFIKETKKMTGRVPSRIFGKQGLSLEKEHLAYLADRRY